MPTYEYRCPKCHRQIELVHGMNEKMSPLCLSDECGELTMERIISPSTFILRGSGWAKDGYGGGGG